MSTEETVKVVVKRERSPAYPFISLKSAITRLIEFETYFGRHSAPANKLGLAWKMAENSSQAASTVSALKSFGLVSYKGMGDGRMVSLTDDGRTYLRAQQGQVKEAILRSRALKPKAISKYWQIWGADRPPDPVSLDELILKGKFTDSAARKFLKVYDDSIAYAGLSLSGKIDATGEDLDDDDQKQVHVGDLIQWDSDGVLQFADAKLVRAVQEHQGANWVFVEGNETGIPMHEVEIVEKVAHSGPPLIAPPILAEQKSANEQEVLRGPLSRDCSYRLIVAGDLGPKEIGKLIKLLEAQKDILSDDEED